MNGATFKKPLSHLSLIIQECWPLLNVWGIIHFDNFGYTHLDHAKSAIHRCLLLPFSFHSFDLRTLHALQLSCSNIAQLPKACKRKTRDLPQPLSQLGTVLQSAFAWLKLSRNQLHFVLLFLGTSMLFDCQLPHAWPVHGRRRFWRDSVHWCCPSGRLPASPGALRSYSNRSSYT